MLTLPAARQIKERAAILGFIGLTERERLGPQAYTRIAFNHGVGVMPKHLIWEKFTNGEEERRATLFGHREDSN